jgi:hypothetical protein
MKVTVVPAQITTIEDRIVGSLGLSQLLLLAAPVFGGTALYVILPPVMHSATYKLVVIVTFAFVCGLLAIRLKDKILLLWLLVILRYNLRARYYIFNKNCLAGREQYTTPIATEATELTARPIQRLRHTSLSIADAVKLQSIIENPAAHFGIKASKKGGLHVLITETKE